MNNEIRFRLALDGVPVFQQGASAADASLAKIGQSARRAADDASLLPGIFGSTSDSLRQLASVAAAGTLAAGFVRAADAVTVLNNQLKLATGSSQAAAQAYEALFGIAQRSRTSFTELGATYASIARATSELGISQGRLLTVTEAIGNSLAISGGSAQGMQAALVQLGQGFASGTLRGEELNSVLEQTPRLARAIADGMGVSIGKLRELGKEGKLTADAVLKALESQAGVLAKEVQSSVATVGQAFTQLGNASTVAVGELDRVSGTSAALVEVFQSAATSIGDVAQAMRGLDAATSSASVLGDAIGTVFETVAVLGANTAYVIKGIGNELGGLAAQAAAIAQGNFAQAADIRRQMVADAERARADVDNLTKRLLQARQLRALVQESLAGVDTRAEDARLTRTGSTPNTKPIGDLGADAKKAAAEFKKLADAGRDLVQVFALQDAGSTTDIIAKWEQLNAARKAGLITLEQQIAAQQRLAQLQPFAQRELKDAQDLARARADARNAEDKGIQEYIDQQQKAREASLKGVEDSIAKLQEENAAAELMRGTNLTLAEAIEQVAISRLREQQARYTEGSEPYLAVEREIEARQRLQGLLAERSVRDASTKAAKDAADEWQRATDDIRSSLTNAFRESFRDGEDFGQAFARNIGAELKARLATAVAEGLAGLALQALGLTINGAANSGGAVQQGSAYLQAAQAANTLYGYGKTAYGYVSGLASTGSTLGASTGAYTSMANSQLLAAYGVEGAGATAGGVTAAGTGAGGASSGIAISTWAAAIAAGVYKANQDYKQGFGRDSAKDFSNEVGDGFSRYLIGNGALESELANALSKIGFSDRVADALSGSLAVSALFGYSKAQIRDSGITGSIAAGDFTGNLTAQAVQQAGAVRKLFGGDDKVTDIASALPEELGRFLDAGAAGILDKAKSYGAALGLPVDALTTVSAAISIKADEAGKITEEALINALGGYGDALVKGFADAVAPLAAYGETTVQTIERVGASILGVNEVLDALGLSALKASIEGGKAATELEALFGGLNTLQQAAGSYLQNYYSDAERAALATKGIGQALAGVGLTLPTTRDQFRALVDAQDLTTNSGRQAFAALMGVADAFAAITPEATVATAKLKTVADLQAAIDANIGKFLTPQQAKDYQYGTVARDLQAAGLFGDDPNLAATLKGASKDQIFAFASQFVDLASNSTDAKVAIVEAAGALADLKEAAGDTSDEFARRIAQFTGSLRSSDLSPLSYREQLRNARGLYESTLGRVQAGDTTAQQDLLGNAQAYLQEARTFFGSGAEYAAAFQRVTTQLDALGAPSVDPQVQAIREQVVQLEAVRSSVVDLSTTSGNRADTQAELARAQIIELQNVVQAQDGTNQALAAGHRALWDQLEALNARVQRLLDNAQLDAVSPT